MDKPAWYNDIEKQYSNFAYYVFVAAVLCLFGIVVPPYEAGIVFMKIIGGIILIFYGRYFWQKGTLQQHRKKIAYEQGQSATATVQRVRLIFLPWRSTRGYRLYLNVEYNNTIIESKVELANHAVADHFPVGTKITVYFDPATQAVFLPIDQFSSSR